MGPWEYPRGPTRGWVNPASDLRYLNPSCNWRQGDVWNSMTGKEIFHCPWSSSTIFQVLRGPLGKCPSSQDSYRSSGCLEYDSHVFKTLWEMPFKLCSSVGDCWPIKMKYPFVDRDFGFTSGRLSKQVDLLGNEKDHKRIPSRPEDSISADARGRFLTQGWTWTTQGKYLQPSS